MTISTGKFWMSVAALVAGLTLSTMSASAQKGLYTPPGTINTCGVTTIVVIESKELGSDKVQAAGNATFETATYTAEPEVTTQRAVSFQASGSSELFGTVTWGFREQKKPTTIISANSEKSSFPATAEISFTASATLESSKGTFVSSTPVRLVNRNLRTFNPQRDERYELAEPVEFINRDTKATIVIPTMIIIVSPPFNGE